VVIVVMVIIDKKISGNPPVDGQIQTGQSLAAEPFSAWRV
jgi:hypothetical protein